MKQSTNNDTILPWRFINLYQVWLINIPLLPGFITYGITLADVSKIYGECDMFEMKCLFL